MKAQRTRTAESASSRPDPNKRTSTHVRIENGTIVSVGQRTAADAVSLDLGDVTLLPGLVDCHTHLIGGEEETPYQKLTETTARAAIEGVFNAPGFLGDLVALAGDPLLDVRALESPRAVVKEGKLVVARRQSSPAAPQVPGRRSSRATTIRWISDVPSPIVQSFTSR